MAETVVTEKWWEPCKVDLKDGEVRGAVIDHFDVKERDITAIGYALHGRPVPAGTYTRLVVDGQLWMTDTQAEIIDHYAVMKRMQRAETKRVLINGLGIGMILHAALANPSLEHIDVVELDARIIELVGSQYTDPRLTIHHDDAYTIKWPPNTRWDVAWHDIWPTICGDNAEGMARLNRRYSRRVGWQGCWCEDEIKRINRRDRNAWR
jgi:hypothetical protein